ncbi:MAG: D-glycerate dehydrogenase [Paracoccaceae bacterium]|nr:D-glycerate dehydrogenase [Paracoccaceae bacterium]
MTRPSILITRPLPDAIADAAARTMRVTTRKETSPMSFRDVRSALNTYDGMIPTLGDPFNADAFAGGEFRCRILANFGAGYNHIDIEAARQAGVAVTNTPGAVTDATADIAVLLMLMTARRAGEGERLLRRGAWEGWHPTQLLGTHLTGKTLGIIGMGRIGRAVACRCHYGFDMSVVYFNRSEIRDPGVGWAQRLNSVAEVMETADVISINVPGGAATHHLIGVDAIARMKPSAILVNTSRGDVVDEAALVRALESGRIKGAGLDVYEAEPEVSPGLLALENVSLLPHLGTAALEVRTEMGLMAVANLEAHFCGGSVPNPVN